MWPLLPKVLGNWDMTVFSVMAKVPEILTTTNPCSMTFSYARKFVRQEILLRVFHSKTFRGRSLPTPFMFTRLPARIFYHLS